MNLTDVENFIKIATDETVSGVAKKRSISQPAVSRSIADFEQLLNVRLFDRIGRNLCLNACGEAVLPYARNIVNSYHNLQANLADLGGPKLRSIKIGISVGNAQWLGDCVHWFVNENPEISLHLLKANPDRLLQMLLDYECDFGISSLEYTSQRVSCTAFRTEKVGVLLSVNHRLANKEEVSILELENEPFLLSSRNSGMRHFANHLCRQAGFTPNIILEADLPGTVEELRYLANGVCFISPEEFQHQCQSGESAGRPWQNLFTYRPLAEDYCMRTSYICVPVGRYLPTVSRDMINYIQRYHTALPDGDL